jgi:hypothetical protein
VGPCPVYLQKRNVKEAPPLRLLSAGFTQFIFHARAASLVSPLLMHGGGVWCHVPIKNCPCFPSSLKGVMGACYLIHKRDPFAAIMF